MSLASAYICWLIGIGCSNLSLGTREDLSCARSVQTFCVLTERSKSDPLITDLFKYQLVVLFTQRNTLMTARTTAAIAMLVIQLEEMSL